VCEGVCVCVFVVCMCVCTRVRVPTRVRVRVYVCGRWGGEGGDFVRVCVVCVFVCV